MSSESMYNSGINYISVFYFLATCYLDPKSLSYLEIVSIVFS